jgi:ADP-heptose:LPS heptosyltransferase
VPPRRVLVVLGMRGVGDSAEATSVFELVTRHWPGTEVVAGVFKDKQEQVFRRAPYVARVVRVHGHPQDNRQALRALPRNLVALRGFDEVLFLDRTDRCAWPLALAARLAGARFHHRHGYRCRERRKSPFADFPAHVFHQLVTSDLLLHRPLAEVMTPRVEPTEEDRAYAEELFARRAWTGWPVVLLNTRGPQYGESMGRWGIERYVALANLLVDRGVTVVVNGGSENQVEEFRGAQHLADPRVELLERPDVGQLAAVAQRCSLVVGEPSGPLSLAMAVGSPTVSIQGPGERDYPGHNRSGPLWWPYDDRHLSVSRVAWCQLAHPDACLCSTDTKSRVKKRLEPWHLWKPYKRLVRRLGVYDRLHRSRWDDRRFRCLEHLAPDEVAAAVLGHLDRTADLGAQMTVRSTPKASA